MVSRGLIPLFPHIIPNTRIEKEFDNKNLYKRVKEGQKLKVTYKQGYDKNGEVVAEYLELID